MDCKKMEGWDGGALEIVRFVAGIAGPTSLKY